MLTKSSPPQTGAVVALKRSYVPSHISVSRPAAVAFITAVIDMLSQQRRYAERSQLEKACSQHDQQHSDPSNRNAHQPHVIDCDGGEGESSQDAERRSSGSEGARCEQEMQEPAGNAQHQRADWPECEAGNRSSSLEQSALAILMQRKLPDANSVWWALRGQADAKEEKKPHNSSSKRKRRRQAFETTSKQTRHARPLTRHMGEEPPAPGCRAHTSRTERAEREEQALTTMCSLLEHASQGSTDWSGRSALSDQLQVLREMKEQKQEAKHRLREVNREYDRMRADVLRQIERISERRKQNELHRTELQWRINEDAENEHELRQLDEELCRRC